MQVTVGYLVYNTSVNSLDSSFTRIPLEVIPYVLAKLPFVGFIRVGASLTYHLELDRGLILLPSAMAL